MSNKKSERYKQQNQEIKDRLNNRPYVLGLDMGVGSIGLSVIALEKFEKTLSPTDIVFTTSRIFSPSQGSADRRLARGQRNAIRHKAHRMEFLWKLLAEGNLMLPYSNKQVPDPATLRFSEETRRQDPYKLRMKGLTEELSTQELGYAIYHIANHRGASSIRTFLDENKSADDLKAEEQQKETEKIASEKGIDTFIGILKNLNEEKFIGYRNTENLKDKKMPLPTRDIIENELQKLLDRQSSFHTEVLTENYKQRIISAVLYENEKIVPEAGNCPYYPNEKKLPKCHFLNEERRLWEALNNARVLMPQQMNNFVKWIPLSFSDEERKELFGLLREGKEISATSVTKLYPQYANSKIQLQGRDVKVQKIKGFRFKNLEEKSYWQNLEEEQQDQFLFDWVNTPDDKQLKEKLRNQLGLSDEEVTDALTSVHLIGDYAPIGKTAMKLIMKYLEDGCSFTEAIQKGVENGELNELEQWVVQDKLPYYGQVLTGSTQTIMGKYWHSAFEEKIDQAGFHKPHTCKEEEKYGRIANPVVHQSLNELRKLVNEIMELLDSKPSEIVVEMGRELKLGAEKRDEISKEQNKREKEAERIYEEYCIKNSLSKKYIQHFRLLEEQNFTCPYCLGTINIDNVCKKDVDIDHILPREDTADDSESNKVLAHKQCNQLKAKQTPFAAFSNTAIWGKISHYLDATPSMHRKKWRFELSEEEYHKYLESKGFLSRFKSDNSYVAKATMEYLRCLFSPTDKVSVRSLNGRDTSLLRKAWNLQEIDEEFGNLHITKTKDENDLKRKNRNDNRHHSLDAIVAGYCSRSFVKKIHDLSGQGLSSEAIVKQLPIPTFTSTTRETVGEQREVFSKTVKEFLEFHGFISVKVDNDKNGSLVKGTVYSILGANPNGDQLVFVVKKKVSNISIKTGTLEEVKTAIEGRFTSIFASWYTEDLKQKICFLQDENAKTFERYTDSLEKARIALEENNSTLIEAGKKPVQINPRSISKKALELCGGSYYLLSNNSRQKTFVAKEPSAQGKGFAYDTGANLCLDLFHDTNGTLCGEVIRKVNAMNTKYVPDYKKKGFKLFERIYQGDILEIDGTNRADLTEASSGSDIVASVYTPNALLNRTYISITTFTETNSGPQIYFSNLAKSKNDQDASFRLSSMQKLHARKVTLSPAGLASFISKPLVNLEKE
jgi:CRISPR-associated endonuclease Csn1